MYKGYSRNIVHHINILALMRTVFWIVVGTSLCYMLGAANEKVNFMGMELPVKSVLLIAACMIVFFEFIWFLYCVYAANIEIELTDQTIKYRNKTMDLKSIKSIWLFSINIHNKNLLSMFARIIHLRDMTIHNSRLVLRTTNGIFYIPVLGFSPEEIEIIKNDIECRIKKAKSSLSNNTPSENLPFYNKKLGLSGRLLSLLIIVIVLIVNIYFNIDNFKIFLSLR